MSVLCSCMIPYAACNASAWCAAVSMPHPLQLHTASGLMLLCRLWEDLSSDVLALPLESWAQAQQDGSKVTVTAGVRQAADSVWVATAVFQDGKVGDTRIGKYQRRT